jgi:hypothetical protein
MLSSSNPSPENSHNEESSTFEEHSNPTICSVDINRLPVVVVEWLDAVCTGGSEWQTFEDIEEAAEKGPSLVRSVGMLVKNAPDYVALTDTIIMDGDAGGYVHVIPKGMIVTMTGNLYETGLHNRM